MPRRGENIYKRKDGRWEGRILKPDGKYQYVYAKSYRDVKEKKKNYKYLKPRETRAPDHAICAAEIFELWLQGNVLNRVKQSTYENYYYCIKNYVIPFFNKFGYERISESTTKQFTKYIKENTLLSEAYKRKILIIFKTALKEIMKGSTDYAPVLDAVELPKSETTAVEVFSMKEQRLVENVALKSDDIRSLGIVLCFYTGIRLGELCALKWGDIDIEAGTMSIARTVNRIKNYQPVGNKTDLLIGMPKSRKSVRIIPLPEFLLKMSVQLKMQVENENSYVLSGSGTPIDPRTFQRLYKKVLDIAGVKDRKFHAIRHTFATRALELGVDIKTLSEILGHSNVSTTLNIYAHSLMEQKKIAIEKLNKMHVVQMDPGLFAVKTSVS